ncbi:killer cell lectin-like receptor subfamily G member 1 [Hypanus sabinus]|uniref:killer cell lectin-like receptor subfamily G member 1 n=1 Tax=Hypanus sabinus TaxID=79690 RepID=UPI0028C4D937|nr:killer cell lectin-like receptor subfamily G member 1 [Hypanus sabinus]
MDDSEIYMKMQIVKPDSPSPSRAAHEQEPKQKIGNRRYRQICLLCIVAAALIVIVVGIPVHDQTCSHDWIRNEDRCYFMSTLETSYDEAKERCSNFDAWLLKINSEQEENVVSNAVVHPFRTYWIGRCENGEEASSLMYRDYMEASFCVNCDSHERKELCNRQHRFICEKRPYLDKDLC